MKKIVFAIFCLYLIPSICSAQNNNYFFKVTLIGFYFDNENKDSNLVNLIYTGDYIEKSEGKNIPLNTFLEEDGYERNNICLLFNNEIYKISFNDFVQEDGWNVISEAKITIINFPGTDQEWIESYILSTGKIKFDPKISLILWIDISIISIIEDESKKT